MPEAPIACHEFSGTSFLSQGKADRKVRVPVAKEFDTTRATPDIRAPMHTGQSIFIRAPRERIFETVRDLAKWPEILPHYRWVRFTGEASEHRIVEMAATSAGIPISWTSSYEADRDLMELRFEHLTKWTKGMTVIWTLTPTRDATRVEIAHHLKFRVPFLGWLADPIIANFIGFIATRTLAEFKQFIETGRRDASKTPS